MTIKFYKNKSDKNHVDKDITQVGSDVTGTFREDVSVTDPVFTIEDYTSFNPATANYCYIATLERYYYITDIKLITDKIYEIHCHVDVLMSFKSGIRSNTAIIARQQNLNNYMLNDGVFKTKANPKFDILKFPSGFSSNYYFLTVAGGS